MDLIETMKLKNVICQETQGVYSDEDQHESRGADVHEDLIERDEETQTMAGLCQRRPSSRGARMCSKTRERDMNNHDHDYDHAAKPTTTKGWRFVTDAILPLASEGTLVGPGKDTHSAPAPLRKKGRGWPDKHKATNTMCEETKNVHGHAMPRIPLAHLHGSGAVPISTMKRTTRCRRSTEWRAAAEHSCDREHSTANGGLYCPSHQRADCRERRWASHARKRFRRRTQRRVDQRQIRRTPSCPQWDIK